MMDFFELLLIDVVDLQSVVALMVCQVEHEKACLAVTNQEVHFVIEHQVPHKAQVNFVHLFIFIQLF
jgi:hypothetical protein